MFLQIFLSQLSIKLHCYQSLCGKSKQDHQSQNLTMLQMDSFVLIVVTFTTITLPSNAIWTSSATKNHSLCALTVRRKSNKSHISSSISASFIQSNPVLPFNNFYSSNAYSCSNVSNIGINIILL